MYDAVEWSHVVQEKGPVVGSCDHTTQLQLTQMPRNFVTKCYQIVLKDSDLWISQIQWITHLTSHDNLNESENQFLKESFESSVMWGGGGDGGGRRYYGLFNGKKYVFQALSQ